MPTLLSSINTVISYWNSLQLTQPDLTSVLSVRYNDKARESQGNFGISLTSGGSEFKAFLANFARIMNKNITSELCIEIALRFFNTDDKFCQQPVKVFGWEIVHNNFVPSTLGAKHATPGCDVNLAST